MAIKRTLWRVLGAIAVGLVAAAVAIWLWVPEVAELVLHGESRRLRPARPPSAASARRPALLVIGVDGVERDLLYRMLRAGELPALALLLGGQLGPDLRHAHLDDSVLATMPSSTLPGWATIFTGVPPARHGVTGNEFFLRDERAFAAPAPVSFVDPDPALAVYTDDTADQRLEAPTVYERIREVDPGARIWVSMSQFHRGADRLLTAKRTAMADAFRAALEAVVGDEDRRALYAELDEEVIDTVVEELADLERDDQVPDVLTIYLPGIDLYAHQAPMGPDAARTAYLREVLDPALLRLHDELERRGALDDRYVVVVSDHGHTEVMADDAHALGTADDELPGALAAAGFRVRPFELEVDADDDFQAVLAYGGATAFVYLADRSTCAAEGQVCDFTRPPRFEEDVVPVADALLAAAKDGTGAPQLRDAIELVLTRRPAPPGADDPPFQVYLGGGELEDVATHLRRTGADLDYRAAALRLHDLAAGPHGDRAGDLLVLARNGRERDIERRYYFSATQHSWHGSPSRKDSEVPLIVAHRGRSSAELRAQVERVLGDTPRLQAVGELLVALRLGAATPATREPSAAR